MEEKRKTPTGALIPPPCNHQPAGIIGNREYLEALKTAIEDALESGMSRADVFMPDGEGHYLMVKLEEWGKAHKVVSELESFYEKWGNLSRNFTQLLLYLFLEKCSKGKSEKESYSCVELYHEFQGLASRLFWNERKQMKLPTLEELKGFFDKLWERAGVPDFCMRAVFYGSEDDIKACIDLSEALLEEGFDNHSLEGVGIDYDRGYFRFLIKDKIPAKAELKPEWKVEGRNLLIPIKQ